MQENYWNQQSTEFGSTSPETMDAAVIFRNATKFYGSGNNAKMVFQNLNMTVLRGTIYGLLGASGCGKTTLLNCLVGVKELNAGECWVLGGKPGSPGSGVPGPRIGYMPQDISLISEFTVRSAVFYFGRIYNLKEETIEDRFIFLSQLLDLPAADRFMKDCSGGQQRRVSFACALVHEPELLILDEPTVGLDPVLRDKIWNHLVELTKTKNTAVIITTHYIEETKQAHSIGLMRGGTLMAEEPPEYLIELFGVETLEDAFLILSERQTRGEPVPEFENEEYQAKKRLRESLYSNSNSTIADNRVIGSTFALVSNENITENQTDNPPTVKKKKYKQTINTKRLKALLIKNFEQIGRNHSGLLWTFLFPIIEMLAFFWGVGTDPSSLHLGVVNDESTWDNCLNYTASYPTAKYFPDSQSCELTLLSCRFLQSLNTTVAQKVFYDDIESARNDVVNGKNVGYMYFSPNFTEASLARQNDGRFVEDYDLDSSELQIWLDMSNRQIGSVLKWNLYGYYYDFMHDLLAECNENSKLANIPIRFEPPIYGKTTDEYLVFMFPAVLVTLTYFMSTSVTSATIVVDRLEGVWDRSLVAGISHGEILFTHFISQLVLVVMQIVELLFISMVLFDMKCNGQFWLALMLILAQGFNGMLNGFFVSITCTTITLANLVTTGSFFIMILMCGLIWPLEGMPSGLKIISLCLPFTVPIISLRDIMTRGWSLKYFEVALGFIVSSIWAIIYVIVSLFILKRKG